MASLLTRSTRRSEGLTTRSNSIHPDSAHNRQLPPSNTGRRKRSRESSDQEQDTIAIKKARNVVETAHRSRALPRNRLMVPPLTDARSQQRSTQHQSATQSQLNNTKVRPPTTHSEKVGNGIKHELDKLQSRDVDQKDEKRKLRSQEGTRFKSELSAYFPDYDVVIGNEPEEKYLLNIDTPIIVVDSKSAASKPHLANSPKSRHSNGMPAAVRSFPDSLFNDLHQSQRVDFTFLDKRYKSDSQHDSLPDTFYDQAHRKAERLERSIRNSEKGRAQHEKDQVIRLLEGLQGHDWLKVMGVSGITESKKKEYEPARDHFIRGCMAILKKFRTWREEEKRRKIEKDMALAAATEEELEEAGEEDEDEGNRSDGDPPDYSEVDHAAARQLHEEAIFRSAPVVPSKQEKKARVIPILVPNPEPEKEFKSFYAKRHLRDAALGKRRTGRSASAWGQPVPDVLELDFDLPEEFRDKVTLEANARRKRRSRRMSKE